MNLGMCLSESAQWDARKGDKDKGLGVMGAGFVVPNEAAMTHPPAEDSFDNPKINQRLAPLSVSERFAPSTL